MVEWFSQSLAMLLFVAGAILLVAEALVPGAHFFVLGIALLTTGIVGIALPPGLGIFGPLILSVVVLAVTGLTLWGYREIDVYGGGGLAKTNDASSLRGTFGYVTERVTERSGEVKLDDGGFNPNYQARSVDGEIEVGTEVMVVDPGGGNVVTVEPVAGDEIDQELAAGRDASRSERAQEASVADEEPTTDASDTDAETATDSDEVRSADESSEDTDEERERATDDA